MSELVVGSIAGLAANSYVVDVASGSTLDLSNGAVFPAGNVIQVVSATYSTAQSTTSSSYVDANLSASITPKSTSSKIIAIYSLTCEVSSSGTYGSSSLFRGTVAAGTNLDPSGSLIGLGGTYSSSGGNSISTHSMNYVDSPSTASSVTYSVGFKRAGGTGTVYVNGNNTLSSLTLMEVAG